MNLIRFIHFLRQNDFTITTSETIDAFRALERLDLTEEAEVRFGLRAILCSTRSEYESFDALFSAFFRSLSDKVALDISGYDSRSSQGEQLHATELKHTKQLNNETARKVEEGHSSSVISQQPSGNTDDKRERTFLQAVLQSRAEAEHAVSAHVSEAQFGEMLVAAKQFVRHLRMNPGRRWYPTPKGKKMNIRRTIRRSLNTGGYPIVPVMMGRRKETARFVLLCDGSRSMAPYAPTFLQFAYALTRQTCQTELFIFSTRMRRVTGTLQIVRPPKMPSFSQLGAEWGGGTRIGEAVEHVLRYEAFRLSRNSTVFIIFSDGLEGGHPEELGQAMRQLSQQVNRIFWLNPLAATPGYEPLARGMRAALPYIDLFSAAHDAMSFQQLAQRLNEYSKRQHFNSELIETAF